MEFKDGSALSLPAAAIADEVNAALRKNGCVVITAPPGAGKSTLLPLTIMDGIPKGKILMLEPRRLAARQIAERMASLLGEPVGKTVGYRIRFETRVSAQTRIEVLTEGILTRMMTQDPTLEGVAALIFDEFHERSLASDTALALALETRSLLRDDLRLVVMSATINHEELCRQLGGVHIGCEGRMFGVEVIGSQTDATVHALPEAVVKAIRYAHDRHEGDILAFLPGEGEIRKCAEALSGGLGDTTVYPLYGMLSSEEQRAAIAPSAPGQRKIVLATPIAETSITIEGVRVVVDSGFCRKMVFDPQSGLSRLETVRISRDMADQRAGRAGRVAPGVCYRLWCAGTQQMMAESRTPEILEADLAPMVADVACWGASDPAALPWITPPPAFALDGARALLINLGATDEKGRITAHGKTLAKLPCHPRIAQMLSEREGGALAADIAALLEEKDPMASSLNADLTLRISELRRSGNSWKRISRIAAQYRELTNSSPDNSSPDPYEVGALLASAFPERIAKASEDTHGRFTMAGGEQVRVDKSDPLSMCEWIAVASVGSERSGEPGRIFLAAPLSSSDLERFSRQRDVLGWDAKKGALIARREARIGCLLLWSKPISDISPQKQMEVICEAALKHGRSMFDFASDEVQNLQRRVAAVAMWHPELDLPDLGTDAVLERALEWLPAIAGKATTASELGKIDMTRAIWGLLSYDQQRAVDTFAPSHIEVPTGSRIKVEYRTGADAPVVRVRLQECFGLLDTPRVDAGRLPVLMELLSPGFKPVQLTSDLRSFWQGTYFEVRSELRRRYPKHSWPDEPLSAQPVRGTGKKK